MEEWKARLVREYKQLVTKQNKLSTALRRLDFYKTVGFKQYYYMLKQHIGMSIYKKALIKRMLISKIDF